MKKLYTIFILFTICFPSVVIAQIEPGQVKQEVSVLYKNAEKVEQRLSLDLEAMFQIIDEAIEKANQATDRIQKLSKKKKLTEKDNKLTLEMLIKLHSAYELLDSKREILYQQLRGYDKSLAAQTDRVDKLLADYEKRLEQNSRKVDNLNSKIELDRGEKSDLAFAQMNEKNIRVIIDYLSGFRIKIKEVKINYAEIDKDIMYFFRNIKNGRESIGYMIDVFELGLELDSILDTTNDINRLNELSDNIVKSLENLTDSIGELKNAADPEF